MARADDREDLILYVAAIVATYALVDWWRNRSATGQGTFAPYAPGQGTGTGTSGTPATAQTLDVLVPLQTSAAGVDFIKRQEGFSPSRTPIEGIPHIGYGHKITPADAGLIGPLTEAEATQLLETDLAPIESAINSLVKVSLTQNQFDALASLIYNIGIGAFTRSTLLRLLNARDYAGAAAQFAVWRKSSGRINPGLVARRARETSMFNAQSAVS